MRRVVFLLVLVSSWAGMGEASVSVSLTWHAHSQEVSDGWHKMQVIAERCSTRVLVMSDHLNGVARYGATRYLADVRAISDADTLCIPGVEVTAGQTSASNDVVVAGLNEKSLGELVAYFGKGAFKDIDTGLPCLRALAQKHGLVLIAAHPDNGKIPFNLAENAKYIDGFELFDSSIWGFDVDGLLEKLAKAYSYSDMLTLMAGSDYHVFISGSIPAWSPLEMPVTRVILAGDSVSEQAVIGALRSGKTYATSLLSAYVSFITCFPGDEWAVNDDADKFKIRCKGMSGKLLHDDFTVFVNGAAEVRSVPFKPRYEGDEAVLAFDFASLKMPDAISMNIDMGGRLVTSSIKIRLATRRLQPALQLEPPRQNEVARPPTLPQNSSGGGLKAIFLLDRSTSVVTDGPYNGTGAVTARFVGGTMPTAWVMEFSGYKDGEFNCTISDELNNPDEFVRRYMEDTLPHDKGTAILDALYLAGQLAAERGAKLVILISDMDDYDSRRSVQDVVSLYGQLDISCVMLVAPQRKSGPFGGVRHGDQGQAVSALATTPRFARMLCQEWVQVLQSSGNR